MLNLKSLAMVLVFICVVLVQDNIGQQVTGRENHTISLAEASRLTKNFRSSVSPSSIIGAYFGKETIMNILNQPGCMGLRYYYGLKDDGTPVLVLVGIDQAGNDIYDGVLAEFSQPCPPYCGAPNPLTE